MKTITFPDILAFLLPVLFVIGIQTKASGINNNIILSCRSDNDLYIILKENKIDCARFNTPGEAVRNAGEGSAVMILADGYPEKTTTVEASLFDLAQIKKLRLYIEYPSFLPGIEIGSPRGTQWERAVVSSESFAPALQKFSILAIHGCRFVTIKADNPDIVMARVAGFDRAVFGLPEEIFPVLFEIPIPEGKGSIMVSSTKLSQFMTARYAPSVSWHTIWKYIFTRLTANKTAPDLKWTAFVRPCYNKTEKLPSGVERNALKRGIEWYFNSHMLLHPFMMVQYNKPANLPKPAIADPDPSENWPNGHRTAGMMKNVPVGNGTLGILEGFDSKIFSDGSQAVRWWNRSDCEAEVAGTMGLAGQVLKNSKYTRTSGNIGDYLFFRSMMSLGDRSDPNHPAYGLIGWNDTPEYAGPGTMNGYEVYYRDDDARVTLGMIVASKALKTNRYDDRISKILLANLRITGEYGFQPNRIDQPLLVKSGWEKFFSAGTISYSPHYQANMWACYLWAFQQTGFELFRKRAETAIEMMMAAYPDKWKWTNGFQQERAKMLLPLAWLIRIKDTPEHRGWLRRIAGDLLAGQVECGAIREKIGETGKGDFPPPSSNEAYGTNEAPLIQENGDAVCDLLYTTNFAFLGLHEAAAATGEQFYIDAEDKLAGFLCRIQIQSEKYPELDGGWFRAFDFNRWEYWASSGDAGWGAWCIETGWTQSWITAILGLRQLKTSLWDYAMNSRIGSNFDVLRKQMLPEDILKSVKQY